MDANMTNDQLTALIAIGMLMLFFLGLGWFGTR